MERATAICFLTCINEIYLNKPLWGGVDTDQHEPVPATYTLRNQYHVCHGTRDRGGQSIASNSHTENGSVPGVEEAPAATPRAATLFAFMAVFLAPASHVGMHSISDTVPGSILELDQLLTS